MIKIKDVSILDILPHTFKTDEYKALAAAIKRLTVALYEKVSRAIFWASVTNVTDETLLDIMAAELDAPFYSTDMPIVQKKAIILGAFEYNRKIGTVSSVNGLLAAAFGGGTTEEWSKYGGDPYHFKVIVKSEKPAVITAAGMKLVTSKIDSIKPKRAKLDGIIITRDIEQKIYAGVTYQKTYKRFIVACGQIPDNERGFQ